MSNTEIEPDHEEGFSRRLKLCLIELAGLVLLGVAVARITLDSDWTRGVPMLVLGAYVLLNPAQVVRFIERFIPGDGF